jgi:hypothetical protein
MRSRSPNQRPALAFALLALPTVFACEGERMAEPELLGVVQIAIAIVPADVSCVRVAVAGTRTVVQRFPVQAAQPAELRLNQLPSGPALVQAAAFAGGCDADAATEDASWVSEATPTVIQPGVLNAITLVMKRNGRAAVTLDFQEDRAPDGATPDGGTADTGTGPADAGEPMPIDGGEEAPVDGDAGGFPPTQRHLYVAIAGDDSGAGTATSPWRTLQHAANVVAPGDVVHVRPGDYVGFLLSGAQGTAALPITFAADPGTAIVQAADGRYGINIEASSHVAVLGFEIRDMPRAGARCFDSTDITIRRNSLRGGTWGILAGFVDDLTVEENVIAGSSEHGIHITGGARRPVVRANTCTGVGAAGIALHGDASLRSTPALIDQATVEANTVEGAGALGAAAILGDGLVNSLIRNNHVLDERASGIVLTQLDAAGPSRDNRLLNNTVVLLASARWAIDLSAGSTNTTIVNNILLRLPGGARGAVSVTGDSLTGLTSDHNVVVDRFAIADELLTTSQWRVRTGQDAATLVSTVAEAFESAMGGDYRPSLASPALDRADPVFAPSTDIEGRARPQGAGPDIGAFEREAP